MEERKWGASDESIAWDLGWESSQGLTLQDFFHNYLLAFEDWEDGNYTLTLYASHPASNRKKFAIRIQNELDELKEFKDAVMFWLRTCWLLQVAGGCEGNAANYSRRLAGTTPYARNCQRQNRQVK